MAVKPATLKAFKQLATDIAAIDKRRKVFDKRIPELKGIMVAAIKEASTPRITVALKAVQAEQRGLETLLADCDKTRPVFEQVYADDEFVTGRVADLDKLASSLEDSRVAVGRHFEIAKGLENAAEKGKEAANKTVDAQLRTLARLDTAAREFDKRVTTDCTQADKLHDQALDALKRRDAALLSKATAALGALDVSFLLNRSNYISKDADDILKGGAALPPVHKSSIVDGVDDIRKLLKANAPKVQDIAAKQKAAKNLQVPPLDLKKAARALGIDAKNEPRLAKAVAGPTDGWPKMLENLSKELKLGKSGRDLAALLDKSGAY